MIYGIRLVFKYCLVFLEKMEYNKNKKKFTLQQKVKVATEAFNRKRKFEEDKRDPTKNKPYYNEKRKKWVNPMDNQGFIGPTVRTMFSDMKNEPESSKEFKNCYKFVQRCLLLKENGEFDKDGNTSKKHFRVAGAGPPVRAVEVRQGLFDFFLDVRTSLKGRLPRRILTAKAKELYDTYCDEKRKIGEQPDVLKFNKTWLRDWCKSYNISLKAPNKRFSISGEQRKIRILDLLQNVWTARYFFIKHYDVDPVIIGSDQMPIHRNESSKEKTLNFSGQSESVFVKENHMLSRERATVMTTISSSNNVKPPPLEFVFKGKGLRVKVNPPNGVTVQWAEKGSYRLEHMVKFIERLPAKPVALFPKRRSIYLLDDYSVHLDPKLEEIAHKRGYFLIVIGGGITGDIQGNDTDYHHPSKKRYRDQEMELMIQKLREHKDKIPTPSRDEMMVMFSKAWDDTLEEIDGEHVFKKIMLTIKFDGSEDHLSNRRLWDLVGDEMVKFREDLLRSPPKPTLKELRKCMIPPKGVKRKSTVPGNPPEDEGFEIFDGEEMEAEEYTALEGESESEEEDAMSTGELENPTVSATDEEVNVNNKEVVVDKNLEILDQIRKLVTDGRKNAELSKELLPYMVKMDNLLSKARRKYLSVKVNPVVAKNLGEAGAAEHDNAVVPGVHVAEESEDDEFPPVSPIPPLDDFDVTPVEDSDDWDDMNRNVFDKLFQQNSQ